MFNPKFKPLPKRLPKRLPKQKWLLALLVCVLFFSHTYSQQFKNPPATEQMDALIDSIKISKASYKYDVAISQSLRLIELAEEEDCPERVFYAYNYMSIIYNEVRDTMPSIRYARKALAYAKKTNNDTLHAWGFNNLGAALALRTENYSEALVSYQKAIPYYKKLNDGRFLDPAVNIAELYSRTGNYAEMPGFLKEAERSLNSENIKEDDPRIYIDILWGDYYAHLENDSKASLSYMEAYKATEKNANGHHALNFYGRYAKFLAKQKDFEHALTVQQKLDYYKDVAKRIEDQENLKVAKAHAETEDFKRQRNEAELQQQLLDQNLKRQNIQAWLLGVLLVLLLLFIGYLFTSIKLRKNLVNDLKKNNENLQQAKISAEKSNEAKGKFFNTLSHEMRTPLYGVTGMANLLAKSKDFKKHEEELRSLKFSADHLLDIINDLLDISKLEDKGFQLQKRPFNIAMLVKEIVNSLEQYNTDQGSTMHLHFDKELPNYVMGDSRRISQIMLNIIGNAIKFTKNGDIWIRVELKELNAKIFRLAFSIKDNGIGMDEQSQKIIFDEFSQLDSNGESERIGTGLGLPIVKKLLDKMNSDIVLESRRDVGSRFSFELDFEEATLLEVIEFSTSQKDSKDTGNVKSLAETSILIVDDNKINRMVTQKILNEKGAHTQQAKNGEEAIDLVSNNSYDLILMDINMPGLNGFETTQAIRNMGIKIPIIALTAADATYIGQEIKNTGMNDAIIKPYSMHEFMKVINLNLDLYKKPVSV